MTHFERLNGYLDVKISSKSRRGLTPWKAWQKQWCEIRRLDTIDNGVELKLKSNQKGNILNCIVVPRCSTICRTDSRTKQYAFGIFNLRRHKKPIVFLSGSSELDSHKWMSSIRKLLSVASYLPIGHRNFHVSIIDNNHSRAAGLIGMHGVLSINQQGLTISDPCTGDPKVSWKWFEFHQFHLQAPSQSVDDKKILVMHTSREFSAGPGQMYLYCEEGPKLLHLLIARGQLPKSNKFSSSKRLSRSEGDLCSSVNNGLSCSPDSTLCFRSQTGSEDSGVRVSISSDDSEYMLKKQNVINFSSMGFVTKTPGGSETEDSLQDLVQVIESSPRKTIPRNESGMSLSSGIYEEIPEEFEKKPLLPKLLNHVYENPLELIFEHNSTPPPLPPRRLDIFVQTRDTFSLKTSLLPFKQRCNTLPAKDLSKIAQTFTSEPEYVDMSPNKTLEKPKKPSICESFYMPMSPQILKSKIENCYMSMGIKKT